MKKACKCVLLNGFLENRVMVIILFSSCAPRIVFYPVTIPLVETATVLNRAFSLCVITSQRLSQRTCGHSILIAPSCSKQNYLTLYISPPPSLTFSLLHFGKIYSASQNIWTFQDSSVGKIHAWIPPPPNWLIQTQQLWPHRCFEVLHFCSQMFSCSSVNISASLWKWAVEIGERSAPDFPAENVFSPIENMLWLHTPKY